MPRILRSHPETLGLKRRLGSEMTPAEIRLWSRLRGRQMKLLKFRRQHGIGPYIVDFYCPDLSLVIEVDGDVHADENRITRDKERESYLASLGIHVIRYSNNDILKNIDGVLEDLSGRLSKISTSPPPSLQRRGTKDGVDSSP